MQKNKVLITQEKYDELKKELDLLISVERPKAIVQLKEAREQGDLSENADYDAAKNHQAEIEGKIEEIQNQLDFCEIIKVSVNADLDKVKIGTVVEIFDVSDSKTYNYRIVGEIEADPDQNKISSVSPLAIALLDRKVNETVEVKVNENSYKVQIKKISM